MPNIHESEVLAKDNSKISIIVDELGDMVISTDNDEFIIDNSVIDDVIDNLISARETIKKQRYANARRVLDNLMTDRETMCYEFRIAIDIIDAKIENARSELCKTS